MTTVLMGWLLLFCLCGIGVYAFLHVMRASQRLRDLHRELEHTENRFRWHLQRAEDESDRPAGGATHLPESLDEANHGPGQMKE